MAEEPASVLLPTTRWTDACTQLGDQLGPADELLVIHDDAADPIAEREALPSGVRLVAAGEPRGCSGKANAIVAGMEAASHDRLVWTDDDFRHPPDWLATMKADYDRHAPISEVPYFVGRDPLSVLLEPLYASSASLPILLGDKIWGGSVIFDRDDIDEPAFLAELRQTISDDALLMEYLQVTTVRRLRTVPIGGTIRASLERQVRWTKILWQHDPGPIGVVITLMVGLLALAVLFPLWTAGLLTVAHLGINEVLGVRRWTAVLAYPAVFVMVPLIPYAFLRRTFVWGGRRYRWPGKFDVEIVG